MVFAPGPTRDPGPSHQAAPPRRRSCDSPVHCSTTASSGLRQGCSTACTLCPSKAAQSVQSAPQLGIFVFDRPLRGRKEASASAPASGCSSRLRLTVARFCSHSSANSNRHTLYLSLAPRWSGRSAAFGRPRPPKPSIPTRATHGQLLPSGTNSTARHSGRGQTSRKILTPGSSSGSAAAVGAHHWITP